MEATSAPCRISCGAIITGRGVTKYEPYIAACRPSVLATLDGGSARCHHRLRERQEVPRAAISADGDAVGNTPTFAVYRPSNTHLNRTFVSNVLWKHESPCITNPLLTFAANHLLNYLLIGYTYHPLLQGRLGYLRRLVGIIGKTPSPGFVVWSSVPWFPFGEHGQHNARFQVRACTF